MTNGIESQIIDLSSESETLTALPILITPQVLTKGGVTTRRTMETDPRTTFCREDPMVSDKLYSVNREHILLWTSSQGVGVMMATSELSEIQPLSDLIIGIEDHPERFRAGDIIDEPDDVILIYVGRSDDAELRAIKERAQVETIIHIPPGRPDDWLFNQWSVGYDGARSTLLIFPGSGDAYLSCHINNNHDKGDDQSSEKKRERLVICMKYQQYCRGGGVIGWQFMGDAAMLSKEEMRIKYPRNGEIYIGDPQERLKYIVGKTKIELTEDQINLFLNLRWIPIQIPQVIYDVGPRQVMAKQPAGEEFVHPATLDEIGILSQVFKFTHDKKREEMLARYCRYGEIYYG